MKYWSAHTHSIYSANDALPPVEEIVERAAELGYPGLALTDHGNISGSVKLYRECKKRGIKPFPGSELYVVHDRNDKKAKRYHMGLVAYTTQGYRNLVAISSLSHANFYHKPLLDLADMAALHEEGKTEGLALTTGCYFGMVIQTLISDGREAAKRLITTLSHWFDVYVEIQMHNIDQEPWSEQEIAAALHSIAGELNLPVIITQDSHYTFESDREHHEALKYLQSWSDDPDSAKFPGDPYHLVDKHWMKQHHSEEVYKAGMKGLKNLLDKHDMYIEEIEEYNYRVPSKYDDPMSVLRKRITKSMMSKGKLSKRYRDAVAEELEVVEVARMAGYLLFVAEVCDHMRNEGMFYLIRGSAAGSLLCYLLDISPLDPLKWKLRYDRFLSKDRTKPPDIDIDVDSERRDELVHWISSNYAVMQICTFGTYSLSSRGNDAGGSLMVQWAKRARKMGIEPRWADAPQETKDLLYELGARELISGYGVHAAGLIVCNTSTELHKYVPSMYVASSKTTVSQYDMKDIESIGLVKLDVLGVKTLSVIRRTMESLGRDPKDGLDFIPLTDQKVYRQISTGDTAGMFQLEGNTSSWGVRQLKPTKIGDVIAAMALFRPGVMTSGATSTYMERKHGEDSIPSRHELIMNVTKETQGILLYQDQVIEILRGIGMSTDDLNVLLKAVKASNKGTAEAVKTMGRYESIVKDLCRDSGMDSSDVAWLWDALEDFSGYSFNRAHATVYGITAYQTAWFIVHHPLEFHAAMLTVYGDNPDKKRDYSKAARNRGLRLLPPDVNISNEAYAPDYKRRGVARSLNSIKGVGVVAAKTIAAHQPYTSFQDFVDRLPQSKVSGLKPYKESGVTDVGTLGLLIEAGALRSLGVDK